MERTFMKGSEAIAEAAVRAGCRFFAGYPITPQNEIPEYFSRRLPEVGGHFVQGESEVASVNMIMGAAAAGAKCMTSSSSVGISLKSEGISQIANDSLPAVIANVMRGGPGGGSIQPAQSDYWQATKAQGNGGFKMIVLAPGTLQEAVDLTYKAFELADRDRNPVMILADGCIGSMMEPVVLPEMKSDEQIAKEKWERKNWLVNGFKYRDMGRVTLDPWGGRTSMLAMEAIAAGEKPPARSLEESNRISGELYKEWDKNDVMVELYQTEDAEYILTGYGTAGRVAKSAVDALRKEGVKVGLIRPITVNPFPYGAYKALCPDKVKFILDVEMAIPGQMVEDVERAIMEKIPVHQFGRSGGNIVGREEVLAAFKALV